MSFYAVVISFCILNFFNYKITLQAIIIHFQKYRMKMNLENKKQYSWKKYSYSISDCLF